MIKKETNIKEKFRFSLGVNGPLDWNVYGFIQLIWEKLAKQH